MVLSRIGWCDYLIHKQESCRSQLPRQRWNRRQLHKIGTFREFLGVSLIATVEDCIRIAMVGLSSIALWRRIEEKCRGKVSAVV